MKTVAASIAIAFALSSTAAAEEFWDPEACRWGPPSSAPARQLRCLAPDGETWAPVTLPIGLNEATFSKARAGDAAAMRLIGEFLAFSPWTFGDRETGIDWLRKAADAGDPQAMSYLAQYYFAGLDADHGADDAEKLFRAAADKGLVTAMFNLGAMPLLNDSETDDAEAIDRFRAAANAGSTDAMIVMGLLHIRGIVTIKDPVEGERWLKMAADAGDTDAMVTLGRMRGAGAGLPRDSVASAEWFKRAADQGDPRAMLFLGLILDAGIGVPEDQPRAVALFRAASDQGLRDAMHALSFAYFKGRGVPADEQKADRWREKAIHEGREWAGYNDGQLYSDQMTEVIGEIEKPLWASAFGDRGGGFLP